MLFFAGETTVNGNVNGGADIEMKGTEIPASPEPGDGPEVTVEEEDGRKNIKLCLTKPFDAM